MTKKHFNTGFLTKRFILMLAVFSIMTLSACSYIENTTKEEEVINLLDTDEQMSQATSSDHSDTQVPLPSVTPDENQPAASEDYLQHTAEPADSPAATQEPEASIKPDEVPESSPVTDQEPVTQPDSKSPSKVIAVLPPTATPKPAAAKPIPKVAAVPVQTDPTPSTKNGATSMDSYADEILIEIVTKGMSEAEKVKAVHDYIVLHTAYYNNDRLKPEDYPEDVFTTRGVLLKGEAVCQGYAETFQLFMDRLGINCKFVVGKDRNNNVGHAWNMVSLDGAWYHVDVTWDDPIPDQKGKIQYKYFLITDEILSADHSWNTNNYPACDSTDYIYYVYEDQIIGSIEDYEQKFVELYEQGERTITILYPEEEQPDLSFFFDYDFLHTVDESGTKHMGYKHYPTWRLGEYTVYTVIVE